MYIILAILAFGVMIFVHELGHFLVARSFGMSVTEFSMGMGPKLWSREKNGTLYSLRAFPFGGFCALEGEEEQSDDPHAFSNQEPWKRVLVLLAGVTMNFLLGFLLTWLILSIDYGATAGFFAIARTAFRTCCNFVLLVIEGLRQLVSGEVGFREISGVVGVVDVINEVGQGSASLADGLANVMFLVAFISVNLGVMNLLPLPALDGGHIFTLLLTALLEKITGKKFNPKVEGCIHYIGLIFLVGLMIAVLFNDIARIVTG